MALEGCVLGQTVNGAGTSIWCVLWDHVIGPAPPRTHLLWQAACTSSLSPSNWQALMSHGKVWFLSSRWPRRCGSGSKVLQLKHQKFWECLVGYGAFCFHVYFTYPLHEVAIISWRPCSNTEVQELKVRVAELCCCERRHRYTTPLACVRFCTFCSLCSYFLAIASENLVQYAQTMYWNVSKTMLR